MSERQVGFLRRQSDISVPYRGRSSLQNWEFVAIRSDNATHLPSQIFMGSETFHDMCCFLLGGGWEYAAYDPESAVYIFYRGNK